MISKKKWVNRLLVCLLAVSLIISLTPTLGFADLPPSTSTGPTSLADGNIARDPDVAIAASYSNTTNGSADVQVPRIINGSLATGNGNDQGWNTWNTSAFPVTVTLTWDKPYMIDATRVMWWYDGAGSGAGVSLPGGAMVQYNSGTVSSPVWTNVSNMTNASGASVTSVGIQGTGTYGANRTWNGVEFEPIVTEQLRLSITKGAGTGVGIGEWEVFGGDVSNELYYVSIQGESGVFSGDVNTYTSSVISSELTGVGYEWTLNNANAEIVGANNGPTVNVRAVNGGAVTLSVKATHTSGVLETTADFPITITATELVSVEIAGEGRLLVDVENEYTSSIYTPNLTGVTYEWTLGNANAEIVGAANGATVKLKGMAEGPAALSVKATYGATEKTDTFYIDVFALKAQTYVTATAAGKAPILPKRVVFENLRFDTPTAHTTGAYDFGEEFNDSLIAVKEWDAVPEANYAADKVGTTFEVNGVVEYKGKDYPVKAEVTVKEAMTAPTYNHSVTSENVRFNDTFWTPKQTVNATSSFDAAFIQLAMTSGSWTEEQNFRNAKARLEAVAAGDTNPPVGVFGGFVFADTDIYKTLEGVAYNLAAVWDDPSMDTRKVELQAKLDSWIELIEGIQYADGYINAAFSNRTSVSSGGSGTGNWRWRYMDRHEMYNIGHFLEAAVAYTRYREGTGQPDYRLYEVGKRAADHIVNVFGPDGYRVEVPGHEEVELGLMKMATLIEEYEGVNTGEKYRETAQTLVDRRGNRTGANARQSGYNGGTYSQDATRFVNETRAVGHAVRAMYFYTGVTDVATWLNQKNPGSATPYLNVLDRIWNNATERNTYITGGIGSSQPGASSEGFGADYALSSTQSYCEICAAIAMSNWNQRLNLEHEDAKYADSYEKSLYNGALVGVNLAGGRFYYSTPIERTTTGSSRHLWESVACCEPNILRTIANMGGYMYTVKQNNVFVNMYAGSAADVNVNGTNVEFTQETNYPWEGAVKMTVKPAVSKNFTINIRIPGWVKAQKNQEVTIKVDGQLIDVDPSAKGYVEIPKSWSANGTVVEIDIPMEVRFTEPDNNVNNIGTGTHSNRDRVAIERGPIVYCLEDAGTAATQADTFNATQVVFSRSMELVPEWRPDLLRGVVTLTGMAEYNGESREVTLTPYYAWNNRGTDPANLGNGATNGSGRMVIWANTTGADVQIRGEKTNLDANEEASYMAVPKVNFSAGAAAMPDEYKWTIEGPGEIVGTPVYAQAPTSGYEKIGGVVGANASNTVTYYASTAKIKATENKSIVVKVEALNDDEVLYTDTFMINPDATADSLAAVVSSYEAEYSEREYDYTAAAWEAYAEAIEDAKAVVENPSDYSLAEADAALTALNNAVTTLLLSTLNTSTLRTSIATAELILIDEDSYIPSYVTALSNALAAAESALVARTSQAQVNAAANALGNVITAKHPKGDLTVLRALDLSTRLLDVYHFTAASWAVLESALEASGDVIAQGVEADTDEVETALTALYNAIDDLVVDVPRRELSQIISGADKILEDAEDSDKYIPAAVANLDAVITAAKAVMENSASSDAALRAQTANLSEAILNLYEKGDKTALQSLYDTLNGYDGTLYTPESWATFRSVLSDIADVIADPNATKEDVSEASRILTEAKAALVEKEIPAPPSPAEKGDKTALQAFYDTLNSYDGTLYTLESWSAFRSLLSNVESVLANPDATKEDVGGAAGKLIDAKNALVQKEVVTPPVTDNRQQAGTIPTTQTPAGNDPQTGTTPGTDASARVDTVDSIRSSQKTIYLPVGKKSVSIPVMTYYTGSGEKPVPTWISNKPLVAKVSSTGKIIPLKAGTAKLTIAAGGKALTLTVKVVKKELNAKKITLKKPPKSLKTGQSAFLTPSISSGKATGVVKWSSSNKKVLKVDKAGKVTALKKGTAKITVKIGKVKRTYSIKVT